MKNNLHAIGVLFLIAVSFYNTEMIFSKKPDKSRISEKEILQMKNEAEDFIDEINDGRQDRQSDAILYSLKGQSADLLKIRNSRNIPPIVSDNVLRKEITGEGSARGIKMRLYKGDDIKGESLPLLIYFHGGGWTIGSLNSCDSFCASVASTGEIAVLSVDYSLAPENQFPKGLYDCVSAIDFAASHAKEWGCSPDKISVGGDSAGGNLAISSALYCRRETDNHPKLNSIVAIYPVLKSSPDESESWKKYSRGYSLDSRLMETFTKAYVESGDTKDPLVSPGEAEEKELSKLPPILLIAAERDILRDQGENFANKVNEAGGKVKRVELPGTVHLFITVDGQPTAREKASDFTRGFLLQ